MTSDALVLDRCSFFEQFQPKHLEKLRDLGDVVRFSKDEIIFREGDEEPRFYVLLSGAVALESTCSGREVRIDTLHAGDELGWSAVLQQSKQFLARALEPVEALAFDVPKLRQTLDANPYFAGAFLERLAGAIARRLQSTRRQLGEALAEVPPVAKAGG